MEEVFLEKYISIITEASYTTTYKMAYAKALVDIASEINLDDYSVKIEITTYQIAEKFIEYYWNEETFCGLKQGPNSFKTPKIVQIVRQAITDLNNDDKKSYNEIKTEYKENSILKSAIKDIARIIKNDVFYRFINLNGNFNYDIYNLDYENSKVIIDKTNLIILKENRKSLIELIDINWKKLILKFNPIISGDEKEQLMKLDDKFEVKIDTNNSQIEIDDVIKNTKPESKNNKVVNIGEKLSELVGILHGMRLDKQINIREIEELSKWIEKNEDENDIELTKVITEVKNIIDDGIVTEDELELIESLVEYYGKVGISSLKVLKGIIEGITADSIVNDAELNKLKDWLKLRQELKGTNLYESLKKIIYQIEKQKNAYDQIILSEDLKEILLRDINSYEIEEIKNDVRNRELIGNKIIKLVNNKSLVKDIHKLAEQQIKRLIDGKKLATIDTDIIIISLSIIALLKYDGEFYKYVEETYGEAYDYGLTNQVVEGKIRNVLNSYMDSTYDEKTRKIAVPLRNAIVPMRFLPDFFIFIEDIYDLNFNSYIDENMDLNEEFKYIYEGLRKYITNSKEKEDDTLTLSATRKAYKLISSTKDIIANEKYTNKIIELSKTILSIIDDYYTKDNVVIDNEYLKYGFEKWSEKKEKNITRELKKIKARWKPKFALSDNQILIIPPEHRINNDIDYKKIKIEVYNDGILIYENDFPEIREVIGYYLVKEKEIIIEKPLGKVRYVVSCGEDIIYDSADKLYRTIMVFDDYGEEIENNTKYEGYATFCYKELKPENINEFYVDNNYKLANKNVNVGDIVDFNGYIFNFNEKLEPGIVGNKADLKIRINNSIYDVYNSIESLYFENDDDSEIIIEINGKQNFIEQYEFSMGNRGIIKTYLVNMSDLKNGIYNIKILKAKNQKQIFINGFSFIKDTFIKYEVEKIDIERYIVRVLSSIDNKITERIITLKDKNFFYVNSENEKITYIIDLKIPAYRFSNDEWNDINKTLWIEDALKIEKIELVGIDCDKAIIKDEEFDMASISIKNKNDLISYLDTSSLISYKGNKDYIFISLSKNNKEVQRIKCYCRCVINNESTSFEYDSEQKTIYGRVEYYGKGNIWIKIVDNNDNIIEEKLVDNSEVIFENIEAFNNYTIIIYEKAKGFTLNRERILYKEKIRCYSVEGMIGKKFKIQSVEYIWLNSKRVGFREEIDLKDTYIKIDSLIDNDTLTGQICRLIDGDEVLLEKRNPVTIYLVTEFFEKYIEAEIEDCEGDGLLLDLDNATLYNEDTIGVYDAYKYTICLEEDENE